MDSSKTNPGKIKVLTGGPYQVTGNVPMSKWIIITDQKGFSEKWEEVMKYPEEDEYLLCRCGQSHNKPYCDGTHSQVEWDSSENTGHRPYLEQAKRTKGLGLELTDVIRLCASGKFCDRAGGTWKLTKRSDDPKNREMAVEQACNCPSGRLVAWDKKSGQPIEPIFEPSIGIIEHPGGKISGPIWVRGGIPIEAGDGHQYEIRNRVTLCRCGRSENKPFCDSTHILIGFTDQA